MRTSGVCQFPTFRHGVTYEEAFQSQDVILIRADHRERIVWTQACA